MQLVAVRWPRELLLTLLLLAIATTAASDATTPLPGGATMAASDATTAGDATTAASEATTAPFGDATTTASGATTAAPGDVSPVASDSTTGGDATTAVSDSTTLPDGSTASAKDSTAPDDEASAGGAAAAGCKIDVAEGGWAPAAAYASVKAGEPLYTLPPKQEGFSRTATVLGLCGDFPTVDSFEKAESFTGDYLLMNVNGSTNISISISPGGEVQSLESIAFSRSPLGADSAVLRLQFAASALVLGLKRGSADSEAGMKVGRFVKEMSGFGPPTTTTPGAPSTIDVSISFVRMPLGDGECVGTVSHRLNATDLPNPTEKACQEACEGSIHKHSSKQGSDSPMCRGYQFNEANETPCITFKGEPLTTTQKPGTGWQCYGLAIAAPAQSNTTVLNDTDADAAAAAAAEAQPTTLPLPQIPDGMTASMQSVGPPQASQDCFGAFDWLVMEDSDGLPFEAEVSDWDDLIAILPQLSTKAPVASSGSIRLDRVLLGSCGGVPSWEPDCVSSEDGPSGEVEGECDSQDNLNAMVTALLTALVTWAVVWAVYTFVCRSSPDSLGARDNRTYAQLGQDPSSCAPKTLVLLLVLAFVTAHVASFGIAELNGLILGAMGCNAKELDLTMIEIGTAVAVFVAVVFGLIYMSRSTKAAPEEKKAQLVVCRVEQGPNGPVAMPVEEQDLQASAMASGTFRSSMTTGGL